MSDFADKIEGFGEMFDGMREADFPPGATVEFLEIDEQTKDFNTIYELTESWHFKILDSRAASAALFKSELPVCQLSVAKKDDDEEFIEAMNDADYIRAMGEVYALRTPYTLQPDGEHPYWRLFGERHSTRIQFSSV